MTIAFGEIVTGFVLGNLTVTGGTATGLTDNGSGSYTATIDATADGAVSMNVGAGKAADLAGNANAASNTFTVTVDTTAPGPVITGPASPSKSDPFQVTIAFGELMTGFVLADLTVTGGAATVLTDNGSGSYTATIDATADGSVSVSVAAGKAADLAGNANAASNTFTVTVDTTFPVGEFVAVMPDPRNSPAGLVTVKFSEPVTGVDADDFILTRNGTTVDLAGLTVMAVSGSQYTLDLSNITGEPGSYVLALRASKASIQDMAGNPLASDTVDTFTVHPWQNIRNVYDVNNDANVTPIDVLLAINHINTYGSGPILAPGGEPPFVDVNGDDAVTPGDVLSIISFINQRSSEGNGAEGESVSPVDVGNSSPLPDETPVPAIPFRPQSVCDTHPFSWRELSPRVQGAVPAIPAEVEGQLAYKMIVSEGDPRSAVGGSQNNPRQLSASVGASRLQRGTILDDAVSSPRFGELEELLDLLAKDVAGNKVRI